MRESGGLSCGELRLRVRFGGGWVFICGCMVWMLGCDVGWISMA